MNLAYLLKVLLRKKLLLILIPLITLIGAFLLTLQLKEQYKSRAQLETGFTNSDQVRINNDKPSVPEEEAKFNNVLETLTSPKVIAFLSYAIMIHDLTDKVPFTVLSQKRLNSQEYLKVDRKYALISFKSHLDSLRVLNSYNPSERDLIEYLKVYDYDYEHLTSKLLYVTRVQGTDFIDVYSNTFDPNLSAFIVNSLCSEFLKYNNINQAERTIASVEAFRKLLAQKKYQLDKKSDSLRNYKSVHGVVNLDNEAKSKNDLIKEFTASLASEQQSNNSYRIELENVNAQLKILGDKPGLKVKSSTNNQEILDLKQKLTVLRSQKQGSGVSSEIYDKKISALEDELAEKINSVSDGADIVDPTISQHDKLLQRKNDLGVKIQSSNQAVEAYTGKINTLNASYSTYATKEASSNALQHDLDIATTEYNSTDEKYNQAVNQKFASFNENIKQSLAGQPAVEPEPSKRWLIIAISVVTSLLLCVFVLIILEFIDAAIKTPYIFSREVGLPLLGVINRVNLQKESLDHLLIEKANSDLVNPEFRDFLKKIRYELDKKNNKFFLFTSSKSGEGKTTIIMALSSVLAAINKRILLIDTNFSNNSLSRFYGSTLSMEDFGNLDFDENHEIISKLIGKTNNKNIDIIGCKGGNYSPSEIFLKKGFFKALHMLTIYYDYIFMEGANLNQYSDSKELAEYSDSVVAVFSARSIIKQNDMNSINFLKDLHGKFGGAILNEVELDNIDV